jgi:N-acetylglucosaminyl-diphospho-decaprenol L-rhamnosyltransferase
MALCGIVMVSYHTGPVMFVSVKNALRQPHLSELIVVDNGNPPDVLASLQQLALSEPRLKVLTGHGNIGFSAACNLGAKEVTAEFLLLLNPDCLLPPDALTEMVGAFNEVPGAVLAGCWLQNPDGSEQRGGRRQLLTPLTALAEALALHRFFRVKRLNDHQTPMPTVTHEVPAISGAFMCMRVLDFQRMYGMDEGYFLHVEDLDLCMRVRSAGGKIICVPRVQVTHMLSTSGEASSHFIEWQKTRGFVRYFDTHYHRKCLPGLLPLTKLAIYVRFALKMVAGRVRVSLRREPEGLQAKAAKRLLILASGLVDQPETSEFFGKTVLITGATGQVGLCVVRRMLAAGATVLAISRSDAISYRHKRLRWIKGDLTDQNLHFEGCLADIAVHCAPLWHLPPIIDLLANVQVKRIVAFSSTSVFGKALSKNDYDKEVVAKLTRAEAELATRCDFHRINWTIFRPTLIYGLGLDGNVSSLARFIRRFGFFPVCPPACGRRQPVHADDLAMGVLNVINAVASFGKIYAMSGGEIVTYRDMLERLFRLCHKKNRIIETTMLPPIMDVAGRLLQKKHLYGEIARRMNDDLIFTHDDASRDFSFSPRPFLSGGMADVEGAW